MCLAPSLCACAGQQWRRSLLFAALGAAPAAFATPLFSLVIGPGDAQNNFNVPKITLSNTSTAGEQITGFSMSIGDAAFVYDFVLSLSSNPAGRAASVATETTTGATLVAGDRVNGSGSVATLVWSFTGFAPGEQLIFEVDVDPVSGGPTADARTVWFNNGAAANAVVQVNFSSGATAGFTMPDVAGSPTSFTFVPEPTTALLLGAGLVAMAVRARGEAARSR